VVLGRPGSSGIRAAARARQWQGRAQCWPRACVAEPALWCGIEAGAECSEEGGGVAVVTGRGELGSWRRHSWPGGGRSVVAAGGRDALLGPVLGKQGSRAEEGERRERERVERERDLTLSFLKNFHMNSKISKNKSCSKFKILQLSFQAQTHLKRS